jgi:hypothetical protein
MKHLALALCLLALSTSCAALGALTGNQIVARGLFQGTGAVWSDGDITLAVGDGLVSMGAVNKAMPIEPSFVALEAGKVFLRSESRQFQEVLDMDQPLPAWAELVFPKGDLARLEDMLGIKLTFIVVTEAPPAPGIDDGENA